MVHPYNLYPMRAGDSLTFDAGVPHGPETGLGAIRLLPSMNYGKD